MLKCCEPLRYRDKPAIRIDRGALAQDVIDYPDACHYERAARLGMSAGGIWHILFDESYKKVLCTRKRTKAYVPEDDRNLSGWEIVYVDESGFANDMPRVMPLGSPPGTGGACECHWGSCGTGHFVFV